MQLKLKNISKNYGVVKALQNVDFELFEGEIHAICGENGAGKSTLMNILSGNTQPDAGEIFLDNSIIKLKNQNHAADLGIAIVYQQLSLFENQNVAENIFVNQFPKTKSGCIDFETLHKDTQTLLETLKISHFIHPKLMVSELSSGQKQMLEIAKALAKKPSILILDEPTASITENDKKTLFDIINLLKKGGTSIIYISHRMDEIFEISDRVTVLKDGRFVATHPTNSINKDALITLMVGRDITSTKTQNTVNEHITLEVSNLSNEKIHNISFKIHKGEIVALAGLVGAGRTEIAKTIFGAMKKNKGTIRLNNQEIDIKTPADAIHNKIAFVPEERKALGLFLDMNVSENIHSINFTDDNPVFFDKTKSTSIAEEFKSKLRIVCSSITQKVADLSGGNQQKVVLSKWLSTNPDLLIIDEPTHGIDVGAKFEIYELLQNLASEGKSILLISSELSEILSISNRVLVVKNGQISQELITQNTNEEEILKWAM